jgi:hypothetical protein
VREEKYKVDLLTADTRQQIDEFPLLEKDREYALTLQLCYLKTKEHEDATESVVPILVVGTALLRGEDYTTKGRVSSLCACFVMSLDAHTHTHTKLQIFLFSLTVSG